MSALVTGAASGIGAAVTARLQAAGWAVAGIDLRESEADVPLVCDVSDADGMAAAVAEARERLGGSIRLLVTVAGYYEMAPIGEISPGAWRRMLAVHVGGTFNACRAVVPDMVAAGEGCIVTISSELGLAGGDGDAHYAAAKGAIIGLTKSLGAELAGSGVRVNSVAPGPCDTPLLAADSPWRAPDYLATLPARRLVTPEEVAETVLFVAAEGTFFAGQVISPNAGAVI